MNATTPVSTTALAAFSNNHNPNNLIYSEIPVDTDALISAITRLAGHINAAQHRFLKLLAALIEREAWSDGGNIKSPAHWLNYYCGIDLGAAREKVRVAKCLAELPQIDEAFASGAISYSKVRAMTRNATPKNEAFLLNIARYGTAHHLEMLLGKYRRVQRLVQGSGKVKRGNSEADIAAVQFAGRELNWHYDDDGMLVIRGRLAPEDGAMFINAMKGVMGQLDQPTVSSESDQKGESKNVSAETFSAPQETKPDTFPQRRADALVLLAEQSFLHSEGDLTPLSAPQRHQLVIHIEKNSLMQEEGTAHNCSIEQGPFLSLASARRLACDTSLLTVLEDGKGNVLNVGRKTRSVSPALRRALTTRDHCCRFPGCTESRFVDAHHIHHWCDGGETSLDNLVLLCRRHHRLVHEQGFDVINRGSGRFEFRRPDRRVLPEALFPQFKEQEEYAEGLAIEREHQRIGVEIDEGTAVTKWLGERMDYSMAVGRLQDLVG